MFKETTRSSVSIVTIGLSVSAKLRLNYVKNQVEYIIIVQLFSRAVLIEAVGAEKY
jgi:hypothetical protein